MRARAEKGREGRAEGVGGVIGGVARGRGWVVAGGWGVRGCGRGRGEVLRRGGGHRGQRSQLGGVHCGQGRPALASVILQQTWDILYSLISAYKKSNYSNSQVQYMYLVF